MKRRIMGLCIFLIIFSGCSTSSDLTPFERDMENAETVFVFSQAEKCERGENPAMLNSVRSTENTCRYYINNRDQILEKQEQKRNIFKIIQRMDPRMMLFLLFMIILITYLSIWDYKKRKRLEEQELMYKEYPFLDPDKPALDILCEYDESFNEKFFMEGIEKLLVLMFGVIHDGNILYVEGYIDDDIKLQLIEQYNAIAQDGILVKFSNLIIINLSIDKYDYLVDDEEISISVEYLVDRKERFSNDKYLSVRMRSKALIKLRRPFCMQTPIGKTDFVTNCKQCGAPVQPLLDQVCSYCGAGLPNHAFTWKVTYCDIQINE